MFSDEWNAGFKTVAEGIPDYKHVWRVDVGGGEVIEVVAVDLKPLYSHSKIKDGSIPASYMPQVRKEMLTLAKEAGTRRPPNQHSRR